MEPQLETTARYFKNGEWIRFNGVPIDEYGNETDSYDADGNVIPPEIK